MSIVSRNERQTQDLAAALAACCRPGDCILLYGDLGAGKTTFARGFVRALSGEEEVVSPTFTLAQSYPARAGWPVWHFDFYRLKEARELEELGLEEALQASVTLIEWPQLAQEKLPKEALSVVFEYDGGAHRNIKFHGDEAAWKPRLGALSVEKAAS